MNEYIDNIESFHHRWDKVHCLTVELKKANEKIKELRQQKQKLWKKISCREGTVKRLQDEKIKGSRRQFAVLALLEHTDMSIDQISKYCSICKKEVRRIKRERR